MGPGDPRPVHTTSGFERHFWDWPARPNHSGTGLAREGESKVTGNDERTRPETTEQPILRLKRLVQLAPQDADLRYQLARELVTVLKFDEAIQVLRSIVALVPNHLEARKLLGMALHREEPRQG